MMGKMISYSVPCLNLVDCKNGFSLPVGISEVDFDLLYNVVPEDPSSMVAEELANVEAELLDV